MTSAESIRHEDTKSRKNGRIRVFVFSWLALAGVGLVAQTDRGGLDPASLLKPLADSWPTYSGDYTGRRYSALTQVNQSNVKHLTLAFAAKLTGGGGGGGGFGSGGAPA